MAEYGSYGGFRQSPTPGPAPVRIAPPNCPGCGSTSVIKVTKKEGANQGREFYTCPRNPSCPKSFVWADGKGNNEPRARDGSPKRAVAPDNHNALMAKLAALENKIDALVAVMTGSLGGIARPMGHALTPAYDQ